MDVPLLILTFIDMALFVVAAVFVCETTMHMFQLNYYRYSEQFRWLRKNMNRYLGHMTLAVLMLIDVLIPWHPAVKASVLIPLFVLAIFISKPKKAKKPLVRTNRVKRMDVTITIILIAVCLIPFFKNCNNRQSYIYLALALTYALSPLIVLAANLINKPIENRINKWYIDDAVRILREIPGR